MNKKQVASWIVTTVLIAGTGAALAGTGDPGTDAGTDTTVTTLVDTSTTTSSVVDDTTTTTVDDNTTTTTVDESTTTTEAPDANTDVADGSETDGGGNSAAAQNHDCDAAWGNHGAWVSANAQAMKTGDDVSCDGPSTTTTVDQATGTTVATSDTVAPTATESTTTSHGNGHGGGNRGHGKKK